MATANVLLPRLAVESLLDFPAVKLEGNYQWQLVSQLVGWLIELIKASLAADHLSVAGTSGEI